MPKGIPLTEEEIDRRRHEIFHSAAALILKQGFSDTSMQEIARAAGVGKSTSIRLLPHQRPCAAFCVRGRTGSIAGTG